MRLSPGTSPLKVLLNPLLPAPFESAIVKESVLIGVAEVLNAVAFSVANTESVTRLVPNSPTDNARNTLRDLVLTSTPKILLRYFIIVLLRFLLGCQ